MKGSEEFAGQVYRGQKKKGGDSLSEWRTSAPRHLEIKADGPRGEKLARSGEAFLREKAQQERYQ